MRKRVGLGLMAIVLGGCGGEPLGADPAVETSALERLAGRVTRSQLAGANDLLVMRVTVQSLIWRSTQSIPKIWVTFQEGPARRTELPVYTEIFLGVDGGLYGRGYDPGRQGFFRLGRYQKKGWFAPHDPLFGEGYEVKVDFDGKWVQSESMFRLDLARPLALLPEIPDLLRVRPPRTTQGPEIVDLTE